MGVWANTGLGDFITFTLLRPDGYAQAELTNSLGITWKIPFFSPNIIALCSFSLREGWPLVPNLIILLFVNRKFLFEECRH